MPGAPMLGQHGQPEDAAGQAVAGQAERDELGQVTNPPTESANQAARSVSRTGLAVGLFSIVLAIAFENIAVSTAMPTAARDLHGVGAYAWAFSLFMIGMVFANAVSGRLSDSIGPAKPMIAGLVVFAAGLLIAGSAQSWMALISGRLIQGLGAGILNTAAYVIIAHVFEPSYRPRMFTYISLAWVFPSIVGPVVSAWITQLVSWHFVFYAVLPVVVFGTVMIAPTLGKLLAGGRPDHSATPVPPAPIWAAAMAALAAGAIQYAGQRLDLFGIPAAVIGVAGLLFGLHFLMPTGFLRVRRGLAAVVLTRLLLPGAFLGAEAFIPLMLQTERGFSRLAAGYILGVGSVGWFAGSWVQSQRWMHLQRDRLTQVGALAVTFGVALAAAYAFVPQLWVGLIAVAWAVGAFGMGVGTASTSVATMALSSAARQGRNAASLNLGDALGSGLFVGVGGSVFNLLRNQGNMDTAFPLAFATLTLVGVFAVLVSTRIGRVPHN
jgi:MFS family permease